MPNTTNALHYKDPQATLDYSVDWSSWLDTDTITSSTWTVPAGLTKGADSNASGVTLVWLSGGTVDTVYEVVNHITTTAGRQDETTLYIKVIDR